MFKVKISKSTLYMSSYVYCCTCSFMYWNLFVLPLLIENSLYLWRSVSECNQSNTVGKLTCSLPICYCASQSVGYSIHKRVHSCTCLQCASAAVICIHTLRTIMIAFLIPPARIPQVSPIINTLKKITHSKSV